MVCIGSVMYYGLLVAAARNNADIMPLWMAHESSWQEALRMCKMPLNQEKWNEMGCGCKDINMFRVVHS